MNPAVRAFMEKQGCRYPTPAAPISRDALARAGVVRAKRQPVERRKITPEEAHALVSAARPGELILRPSGILGASFASAMRWYARRGWVVRVPAGGPNGNVCSARRCDQPGPIPVPPAGLNPSNAGAA